MADSHKSLAALIERKKNRVSALQNTLKKERQALKDLQERKKALPAPAKPAKKTKATHAPT